MANVYNVRDQTSSAKPAGGSSTSFEYVGPSQFERTKKGTHKFIDAARRLRRRRQLLHP